MRNTGASFAALASYVVAGSVPRRGLSVESDGVPLPQSMDYLSMAPIFARQDANDCTYTDFADAVITQTSTFYDPSNAAPTLTQTYTTTVSGGPGCQCADGSQAGLTEELGDDGFVCVEDSAERHCHSQAYGCSSDDDLLRDRHTVQYRCRGHFDGDRYARGS